MKTSFNNYLQSVCETDGCRICGHKDYTLISNVSNLVPDMKVDIVKCPNCGHLEIFAIDQDA